MQPAHAVLTGDMLSFWMKYCVPTASCNTEERSLLHTEEEIPSDGTRTWTGSLCHTNVKRFYHCHHPRKPAPGNVTEKGLCSYAGPQEKSSSELATTITMPVYLSFWKLFFIASMVPKYWANYLSHLSTSINHTFCFAEHVAQPQVLFATQSPDCYSRALYKNTLPNN